MRNTPADVSLFVAVVLGAMLVVHAEEKDAPTTEVNLKGLVLKVPTSWEKEEPKSRLRIGQFRIPAIGEDKEDGELAIFNFGSPDISANVRRWISQYEKDGRETKISTGNAMEGKYVFVELSGTYLKPVGPPVQGKTEPMPGARTLAVILAIPEKRPFFLKMVGPEKTIAAQAESFRTAFGAKAENEKQIDAGDNADDKKLVD